MRISVVRCVAFALGIMFLAGIAAYACSEWPLVAKIQWSKKASPYEWHRGGFAVCQGETVYFRAVRKADELASTTDYDVSCTDQQAYDTANYQWDFNYHAPSMDTDASGVGVIAHQFNTVGSFNVRLFVYDDAPTCYNDDVDQDEKIDVRVGPGITYVDASRRNDSGDGLTWETAKKTINAGLLVACGDIWVADGVYRETITLPTGVKIYGGFEGNETQLSQRNCREHESIIDGSSSIYPIFTLSNVSGCVVDGFTIRRGNYASIYTWQSTATISNNIIRDNVSDTEVGGLYGRSSNLEITNNVFIGNMGDYSAGAISLHNGTAQLTNNTIVNNVVRNYGRAGGIYLYECNPTLTNNLIAFNASAGIYAEYSYPTYVNNNVYGNGFAEYAGWDDESWGWNSNDAQGTDITPADPKIPYLECGDWHIATGSPCIDQGATTTITKDIDCRNRVYGSSIDIGADEWEYYYEPQEITAEHVCVSTEGSNSNNGSSWYYPVLTLDRAVQIAATKIGPVEIWVRQGTYDVGAHYGVKLKSYMKLYGGFSGYEGYRDARNPAANPTILDGGGVDAVVTFEEAIGCRVDGFTLRNGGYQDGAGVHCFYATGTIANNIIRDNNGSWGGGIYGGWAAVDVINNAIINNSGEGAGIYYESGTAGQILNNTIIKNNGLTTNCGGVKIDCNTVIVANNIIAFNTRGGLRAWPRVLEHNDVYGNTNYNYIGNPTVPFRGDILPQDPNIPFINSGDWHISCSSPCVDAGDNTFVKTNYDLDGQDRILNSLVDIGADETGCTLLSPIRMTATATNICAGSTVTLTAEGGYGCDLMWYANGPGPDSGGSWVGTGRSIEVSPTTTTSYYAQWEACGEVSSYVWTTINVYTTPSTPINVTANPPRIFPGYASTLSANGQGNNVDWYVGGCNGTKIGSNTFNVYPTVTTTYYAKAVNPGCTSDCATVTVYVADDPEPLWQAVSTHRSCPLVADLVPGGNPEVAIIADQVWNGTQWVEDGKAHIWRADGSQAWVSGDVMDSSADNTLSAADIDQNSNGYLELVVPDGYRYGWDETMYGLLHQFGYDSANQTFAPIAGWPGTMPYGLAGVSAAIGDANLDGSKEIVAGDECCYVHCWNPYGDWRGGYRSGLTIGTPVWHQVAGTEIYYSSVALGDVNSYDNYDADHMPDALVGTPRHVPWNWGYGYSLWGFPGDSWGNYLLYNPGASPAYYPLFPAPAANWPRIGETIESSPAIGDLDEDGYNDFVAGAEGGLLYVWLSSTDTWNEYSVASGHISSSPVIASIGGDPCAVFGSNDGRVYAIKGDGTSVTGWSGGINLGAAIIASPLIADVVDDVNHTPEVVIACTDGWVYAFNQDGSLAQTWQCIRGPGQAIYSTPAVCSLDGQYLHMIVGSTDGIYKIQLYNLNGATFQPNTTRWPWPTFHYNNARTGCTATPVSPVCASIAGTVTLNGTVVQGARIYIYSNSSRTTVAPVYNRGAVRGSDPVLSAGYGSLGDELDEGAYCISQLVPNSYYWIKATAADGTHVTYINSYYVTTDRSVLNIALQ